MALDAAVARRYARAFAELCDEEGATDEVLRDLSRLQLLLADPACELVGLLSNPIFTLSERQVALQAALDRLDLHPLLTRMLTVLLARNRFAWLPQVLGAWRSLADRRAGVERATVTTALPLDPGLLDEIRRSLSRALDAEVLVSTRLDPSLIAGLLVEVRGTVYDASLRSRLLDLQRALLASQAIETPEA